MKKINALIGLLVFFLAFQSCSKLEYSPKDQVFAQGALKDYASANAAVAGLYDEMQDATLAFDGYLSIWQYFSDECDWTGTFPTRAEFDRKDVFPSNSTMEGVFSAFYDIINYANYLLEELPNISSADFTADDLNKFSGEARLIRGFAYLHLVLGWGDVPIVLKATRPDAVGDDLFVSKSPASEVWSLVVSDLEFAEKNIGGNPAYRASANAATALLSRVYLYQGEWQLAYDKADAIIQSGVYSLVPEYENVFKEETSENIWILKFNKDDQNSNAFYYFPAALGGRRSISPSPQLIAAYEDGDARKDASVAKSGTQNYGIKYMDISTGTDPLYFIRYAEVLLNAAEAAAELGMFDEANTYYNMVRNRAGLADKTLDASNYVDLLLQERFVELAMEGFHRLVDLRRRGKAMEVLEPEGYDPCDAVWPLPQRDIDRNPNLEQNGCCNC